MLREGERRRNTAAVLLSSYGNVPAERTANLSFFTGFLISDGYGAYQDLPPQLAGVQQCCHHVIRRCRAVTKPGPGGL